ncbi:MAG: hypothetical protein FWG02_00780 [Holophagaceae bacterium]|nr:hypothetical protein [Holophagaceae bacterium]
MFFPPPQEPPAIIQESFADVPRLHPADYGPPKSAMTEKHLDIKTLGTLLYGVVVVIEGTPFVYGHESSPVVRFNKFNKNSLGFRIANASSYSNYAWRAPYWWDAGALKSGPNVVQRIYPIGF